MTPIIITLSLLIPSQLGRKNSGTDLGTGYGGTVCGFHTRPIATLIGVVHSNFGSRNSVCRLLRIFIAQNINIASSILMGVLRYKIYINPV